MNGTAIGLMIFVISIVVILLVILFASRGRNKVEHGKGGGSNPDDGDKDTGFLK